MAPPSSQAPCLERTALGCVPAPGSGSTPADGRMAAREGAGHLTPEVVAASRGPASGNVEPPRATGLPLRRQIGHRQGRGVLACLVAGSGRGCLIPVECRLAIAASKMRGENAGSATMPDGGAMIKHGRFCGSIPGCGTSRTIDQPGAALLRGARAGRSLPRWRKLGCNSRLAGGVR